MAIQYTHAVPRWYSQHSKGRRIWSEIHHMNYELLAFTMGSVVGLMGYLVECVYRKEVGLVRMHRGLRRYMQHARHATPEMSS